MRLFTKFFALCALALCSTLCFALFLASQHYYRLVLLPDWAVGPHDTVQVDQRLVVFGDSWSDNNAASIQGLVWTDQLCSQVRLRSGQSYLHPSLNAE